MHGAKFKPGDRVVNTSFFSDHEGVGGTVIEVSWVPSMRTYSNTTTGTCWQFVIILDTAEYLTVVHTHSWVHEQDYHDGSYIPF